MLQNVKINGRTSKEKLLCEGFLVEKYETTGLK